MINATVAGNLGRDAETRQAGQATVTSFGVAVEQRKRGEKYTQWVNCSIWGTRGEKVAQYLTKGTRIAAAGELTTREYDGKTYLELNVSDFTLMGGGQDRQQQSRSQEPHQSEPDMGDDLPF